VGLAHTMNTFNKKWLSEITLLDFFATKTRRHKALLIRKYSLSAFESSWQKIKKPVVWAEIQRHQENKSFGAFAFVPCAFLFNPTSK
jgi:hypothetical protein